MLCAYGSSARRHAAVPRPLYQVDETVTVLASVVAGATGIGPGSPILITIAIACHYGNGVGAGEVFPTKARLGVGGGGDDALWMGDFVGTFGDSGSALNGCETDGVTIVGTGAAGVLTRLRVSACPCDLRYKHIRIMAEHGVVFGTTTGRAIEMGREAGLDLSLIDA